MLHVAVEKIEVGAAAVKIRVDVVLLRAWRQLAIVEKINHSGGLRHRAESNRSVLFTSFINVLVHAIMK